MFIPEFRIHLELSLQKNNQTKTPKMKPVPGIPFTYLIEPEDNDNLTISLRYNDSDYKLAIAPYIDGLNTMQEGAVLPIVDREDISAHDNQLAGNYGSNVYIRNWKTNDGSNPKFTFTKNSNKTVANYILNADPTEQNTIRLFLWTSKKPVEKLFINATYVTKGGIDFGTRGSNDGTRGLGGVGLGDNTNTNYYEVEFENPKYLGCITIFYKIVPNQLPKFDESYFNNSPFRNVPKV